MAGDSWIRKASDRRVLLAMAGRRWRAPLFDGNRPENCLEGGLGRLVRVWVPGPDEAPPGGARRGPAAFPVRAPLTPLAVRPTGVSRGEAYAMLRDAVRDLPVDRADRTLLVRAEATWDAADLVILASLLARARRLGPQT